MGSIPVIKKNQRRMRTSRGLIILLLLFFISILAMLFFNSSLSEIQSIEIEGAVMTSESDVVQASGLQLEDSFFAFKQEEAEKRIEELEWVSSVNITKQFPGKIHIDVIEHQMVAYELTANQEKLAVLSNGSTLPLSDGMPILDIAVMTGWEQAEDLKRKLAVILAQIPKDLTLMISEIKPIPTSAYPDKIRIYTRSSFEIVTTIDYLPDKLPYVPHMIQDLLARDISEGTLTLLEADTHSPFEKDTSKLDE